MTGIEISIIALGVLAIVGIIFKSKLNIKFGNLGILVDNSVKIKDYILKASHLAEDYSNERCKLESTILRNQMSQAEGVLTEVCRFINADKAIYDILHGKTKGKMKENGFSSFDSSAFSKYVGQAIDEYRQLLKIHINDTYLDSPDFSNQIASIFNHAMDCASFWNTKVAMLEAKYKQDIENLTHE